MSSSGVEILQQLKQNNILVEATFVEILKSERSKKETKKSMNQCRLIKKIEMAFKDLQKKIISQTVLVWICKILYLLYSKKVYIVDNFNDKQCEQLFKKIKPDIIILGGCYSIIRGNIIKIPKLGILNVHPGLLPKYRGVSVVQWAIYNEDAIGVTVHFVDEGVDTGGIVEQKEIAINKNDTLKSLRTRCYRTGGELLSKIILKMIDGKTIQAKKQSKADEMQYFQMPKKLLKETNKKLGKIKKELKDNPLSYKN